MTGIDEQGRPIEPGAAGDEIGSAPLPDGAARPTPQSGPRSLDARLRDHASIGRLADDLLPALIAKLSATALGEIEVREDAWKVRLRRPADALGPRYGRRSTDLASHAQPGHAGHGRHAPSSEPHPRRDILETAATSSASDTPGASGGSQSAAGRTPGSNGSHHQLTPVGPGPDPGARVGRMGHLPEGDELASSAEEGRDDSAFRVVATSPAVGIFQARPEGRPGTRVRAGDRIASVDVLGVAQPVVSPVDGLVGATLVENGDPVEYGQDLVRIELPGSAGGNGSSPPSAQPVASAGPVSGAPSSLEPSSGSPGTGEA